MVNSTTVDVTCGAVSPFSLIRPPSILLHLSRLYLHSALLNLTFAAARIFHLSQIQRQPGAAWYGATSPLSKTTNCFGNALSKADPVPLVTAKACLIFELRRLMKMREDDPAARGPSRGLSSHSAGCLRGWRIGNGKWCTL